MAIRASAKFAGVLLVMFAACESEPECVYLGGPTLTLSQAVTAMDGDLVAISAGALEYRCVLDPAEAWADGYIGCAVSDPSQPGSGSELYPVGFPELVADASSSADNAVAGDAGEGPAMSAEVRSLQLLGLLPFDAGTEAAVIWARASGSLVDEFEGTFAPSRAVPDDPDTPCEEPAEAQDALLD